MAPLLWGGSSAGRASRSQCEGREFDPPPLHQNPRVSTIPQTEHHEQRDMLRASVADFVARRMDIGRVRRLRDSSEEYERGVWEQMAQLGWLGVLIPEKYGGLGLGLAEAAIIAAGLSRSLAPEPYTSSAVLAASAITESDNERLKSKLLEEVVSGRTIPALAWQEQAGDETEHLTTRAVRFEGGYRLNGHKRFISGAAGADGYIVTAGEDSTLALFWIPGDTPGATLRLEKVADGRHFGALSLADVVVSRENMLATGSRAQSVVERALDNARVIASAELCGVMSRALDMTVDYLKTRVQFGKPIGSFQALQHRAVDLYMQQQLASAVLEHVIVAMEHETDPRRRSALASRAKARCAEAALTVTRAAIQLHGAIGFTDEYDAGLYLKRAMVLAAWLGGATWHRRRYARLALETEV
jgi:alkylation response protein AidB-like acyl-CoA dehydrogenase